MGRSERWNTSFEIINRLKDTRSPASGAGPVVYVKNGKKYLDDTESHIAVIGRTGTGKSQCGSLPFMTEVLEKRESLIMIDPKGEGYRNNAWRIPKDYQVFCIDFRSPRTSPTRWNPLSVPLKLFKSKDPDERDIASAMISDFWKGVFPDPANNSTDPFWNEAAINYARGLTYGLFETADEEYVNLDSIVSMMEESESSFANSTVLKQFYSILPPDSLARRNLATYESAPNDTRASIHSVAVSGLEIFSRSKGLMEMLSEDTLNFMDIDLNRPFALIIIMPDETDIYDILSGLLITQISQHLYREAFKIGGALPVRVNIILEELGSVGRSIPTLPSMMVAGRSRNIRLMLVMQSLSQLDDVYGKSKAETINSCIGITIGFSTNNWETLYDWSHRCGEKIVERNGFTSANSLITAPQLAAMPVGTALVILDNQYKFISHLPFFDEMFDNSNWNEPPKQESKVIELNTLNFKELVKDLKDKELRERIFNSERIDKSVRIDHSNDVLLTTPPPFGELDWDELLNDSEEQEDNRKFRITFYKLGPQHPKVLKTIRDYTGLSLKEVLKLSREIPFNVFIEGSKKAEEFHTKVFNLGAIATKVPEHFS